MLLNNLNKNRTDYIDMADLQPLGNSMFLNAQGDLLILLGKQEIVTDGLLQHLIGGVDITNNIWLDQSGNDKHATLVNSPLVQSDYIELDGVDDYVIVDNTASLTQFSISLTIEYLTLKNKDRLLNQISDSAGRWSLYAINSAFGGTMEFYTNPLWHDTTFVPTTDQKYTIDFTVDNTAKIIKIYVNAVLFATINDNVNYTDLGIGNKYRGIYGTNANLKIYDYKHYNRILNDEEVSQNYSALNQ